MTAISVFVLFAALSCNVQSFFMKFEKERNDFDAFLQQIYGTSFQMDVFVDIMWPTVQELVPETVELPAIESFDPVTDQYTCVTNTTVHMTLGEITSKKQLLKTKERITYEVEAELLLDAKPVELGIAKTQDDRASPLVHVSYLFKEPSKVRFILEIQNFLNIQNMLPPSCVIRIKNIHVDRMREPEVVPKRTEGPSQEIENYVRDSFMQEGPVTRATVGLVRAVKESLISYPNYWICSSKYLDRMEHVFRDKWEYTDNYNKYCLKKGEN